MGFSGMGQVIRRGKGVQIGLILSYTGYPGIMCFFGGV